MANMRKLVVQQWVTVDNIAAEEDGGLSFVSGEPFSETTNKAWADGYALGHNPTAGSYSPDPSVTGIAVRNVHGENLHSFVEGGSRPAT